MPEPILYLKAMGAAAVISTLLVLVMLAVRRIANKIWLNLTSVVAIGCGLTFGYHVLSWQLAWPPRNALERLLMLIVPATLIIELIAGIPRLPNWIAWLLRISLAAAVPRILMHGSVYLSETDSEWNLWQTRTVLAVCGLLLAGLWGLLSWLSHRGASGISISFALLLSTLCAGLTVMLAGYIKGGAAAFPLIGALLATSIVGSLVCQCSEVRGDVRLSAIIGVGVVGLFGLLFIGRFFGELSTENALAILLSPLLCWATEIPRLRLQNPWLVGSIRLVLVAIPLVVVLIFAKRDFDRDMAPLLINAQNPRPNFTVKMPLRGCRCDLNESAAQAT